MKIFSLYMKIAELDIRTFLNQVLFYYRKIPVLNWLSPGSSYKMEGLKSFFSFFAPLGTVIVKFSRSLLYYGIIALISFGLSRLERLNTSEIFLNFLLITIFLDFSKFYFDDMKEKVLIHYSLFKVDPKNFTFSGIFLQEFVNIFGSFISLSLVGRILSIDPRLLFSIAALSYLISIFYNGINFTLFDKGILNPNNYENYNNISRVFMVMAIILNIIFAINLSQFIINSLGMVISFILCIVGVFLLIKLNSYTEILLSFEEEYSKVTTDSKDKIANKTSLLKTKDLEASKSYIRDGLKGYKLLNEIFFQRHRRLMLNPILIKSGILALIFLVSVNIRFIWNLIGLDGGEIFANESINNIVTEFLPGVIPIVSYLVFFQESTTRTMFINCDQALMQYGFYRRPNDLLKMFRLRFIKLLFWNGLPLLIMGIWLIGIRFIYNVELFSLLIVGLQIISLWFFFSIHTLFIYYIFQPYNDKYELKHPIYQIINGIVYMICYFSMNSRWSGPLVAPGFIVSAILYSVIALILVYKLAPKTFKVRISK